jgi:ribbon-helix-helix CopG family protein
MYDMGNTITIRADPALREALAKRARLERKTVSDVVREILANELTERPLAERIGKLRGGLRLGKPTSEWQRRIRERNWRS